MSLVLPKVGLPRLLARLLKLSAFGGVAWQLFLFRSNTVPDEDTVFGDLVEASFGGYSRVTMSNASWTDPVVEGDHSVSTYQTTPQVWTCTGSPQTIYGYGCVDLIDNTLYIVERYAVPELTVVGAKVGVLPRFTLKTC